VAKWLLEVKNDIDVSANNECAFWNACHKGQVAKWLKSFHNIRNFNT
jgi:hypothetical protein